MHFFTGAVPDPPESCNSAALVLDCIGQLASSNIIPALEKVTLACSQLLTWCYGSQPCSLPHWDASWPASCHVAALVLNAIGSLPLQASF